MLDFRENVTSVIHLLNISLESSVFHEFWALADPLSLQYSRLTCVGLCTGEGMWPQLIRASVEPHPRCHWVVFVCTPVLSNLVSCNKHVSTMCKVDVCGISVTCTFRRSTFCGLTEQYFTL